MKAKDIKADGVTPYLVEVGYRGKARAAILDAPVLPTRNVWSSDLRTYVERTDSRASRKTAARVRLLEAVGNEGSYSHRPAGSETTIALAKVIRPWTDEDDAARQAADERDRREARMVERLASVGLPGAVVNERGNSVTFDLPTVEVWLREREGAA